MAANGNEEMRILRMAKMITGRGTLGRIWEESKIIRIKTSVKKRVGER